MCFILKSTIFYSVGSAADEEKSSESQSETTTKVIEESSSTLEVSEKHTSKVEASKITLEQTVTVAETGSETIVTLQEESSSHFSSGMSSIRNNLWSGKVETVFIGIPPWLYDQSSSRKASLVETKMGIWLIYYLYQGTITILVKYASYKCRAVSAE